mgnify:CR=1 FL=1
MEKILDSETMRSIFEQSKSVAEPEPAPQHQECIFAQILRDIEEKRMKRIQEEEQMDNKKHVEEEQRVEEEEEEEVEVEEQQKLIFLDNNMSSDRMSTEDEIKCKQQQLDKIFQLLKEQEMIKNFEDNIGATTDMSHLKNLNEEPECDFRFTVLNSNFEEKEVELKDIFESQMKLYGLS